MQKKVQRKEIDIIIGSKGSPSKPAVGSAASFLPDPNEISLKYGLESEIDLKKQTEENDILVRQTSENVSREYEVALSTMKGKLEEKNRKIENLCVLLEALEPVPGVDPIKMQAIVQDHISEDMVDLRDAKIVSLAKKAHRLTMQVNKERASSDRFAAEAAEYRQKCDLLSAEVDLLKSSEHLASKSDTKVYNRHVLAASSKKEEEEMSINHLQKSLREATRVADDMKLKVKDLTDENKALSKALMREVGEGVTLEQAVDGGWRGRAQQIIMLKSKVKNLEAALQQSGGSIADGTIGGRSSISNNRNDVDSKAVDELQEMSRERRQVVEALTEDRVRLAEQNQALEKKLVGTKARVQVLENESRKMKESLQVALDKSSSDDQLLEALRAELARLQGKLKSAEDLANSWMKKAQSKSVADAKSSASGVEWASKEVEYQAEISRLNRLTKNQAEQLDSQDVTIRQLRKKLNTYS